MRPPSDPEFAHEVVRAAAAQVASHPLAAATACDVRLDGRDLVFEGDFGRWPGGRVAYRIEAVPDDEPGSSPAGCAGIGGLPT